MRCHVTDLLDLRDCEAQDVLERLYRLSRLNFEDETKYSNVVISQKQSNRKNAKRSAGETTKKLYLHAHLQHIIGIVIAQNVDVNVSYRRGGTLAQTREKRDTRPPDKLTVTQTDPSPSSSAELSASLKNGFVHRTNGTTTLVDRSMTMRIKKGTIKYASPSLQHLETTFSSGPKHPYQSVK